MSKSILENTIKDGLRDAQNVEGSSVVDVAPIAKKEPKRIFSIIKNIFYEIIPILFSLFIYFFLAIPNQVDGRSMEPNFHHNDVLITNRVVQWFGEVGNILGINYNYKRGDVIVFTVHGQDLIKRIIAVGGDKVYIKDGYVYVNNVKQDDSYILIQDSTHINGLMGTFAFEGEEVEVPKDQYFVLGDNRTNSQDSRFTNVGFVSRIQIKGRVSIKVWPFPEFGFLKTVVK